MVRLNLINNRRVVLFIPGIPSCQSSFCFSHTFFQPYNFLIMHSKHYPTKNLSSECFSSTERLTILNACWHTKWFNYDLSTPIQNGAAVYLKYENWNGRLDVALYRGQKFMVETWFTTDGPTNYFRESLLVIFITVPLNQRTHFF